MNEAQVKSEAKVRGIVMQYRTFKIQRSELDERLKKWRGMLKNLLPILDGKWQDADGYARIEEYKETYSYDKAKVDEVMYDLDEHAFKLSGQNELFDAIAVMLRNHARALRLARKPRAGYTTVKVK